MLNPLTHGVLPSHHAEEVPIGCVVPEGRGLEGIHKFREAGPGNNAAANALSHIGRADKEDAGIRSNLMEVLNLGLYLLLVLLDDLGVTDHRHVISAKLEDDETGVHHFQAIGHKRLVDAGENGA